MNGSENAGSSVTMMVLVAVVAGGVALFLVLRIIAAVAWRFRQAGEKLAARRASRSAVSTPVPEPIRHEAPLPQYSENVVRVYGQFLTTSDRNPMDLRDEGELPYPKWHIAVNMLAAISAADTQEMKSALSISLLSLASYQPRLGKPLHDPVHAFAARAGARGRPIEESDVPALAAEIAAAKNPGEERRYEIVRRFADLEEQWLAQLAAAHSD